MRTTRSLFINNGLTYDKDGTTALYVLPLTCVQLLIAIPPLLTAVERYQQNIVQNINE